MLMSIELVTPLRAIESLALMFTGNTTECSYIFCTYVYLVKNSYKNVYEYFITLKIVYCKCVYVDDTYIFTHSHWFAIAQI